MNANASEDNGRKAKHGSKAKDALQKAIDELIRYGALINCRQSPSYGYKGYDQSQFDAHKEITYSNGDKAILYSTTSLRSDRIETNQWRAHNIKRIDPEVQYAFVVLPDEHAYDKGTSTRDKIRNGSVVSAIDDIVTIQEFYDKTTTRHGMNMSSGANNDLQGRKLEDLFASILSDAQNIYRYNGSTLETGYMYDVFFRILRTIGVPKGSLFHISATTDIPPLPSGGNPKTDVAATIELANHEIISATFSLKNTSRNSVSVHEYAADTFADVLDPNNNELRRLLNAFQSAGNKRDMIDADIESLTEELSPYLDKLNRWVFSGDGAIGVEPIQIAQYIVIHNKNSGKFTIHTIDEYCAMQKAQSKDSKWFGTAFSWTYPSKKRGEKIQLKARILE